MLGTDLIMELTGESRNTQIQPPKAAWTDFFRVPVGSGKRLPVLQLRNAGKRRSRGVKRPVVEHDHNWTVEIPDAGPPRPAILHVRRLRSRSFEYWVYRPGSPEFDHCDWMLDEFRNPKRRGGRRWLVI